MNLSYSVPKRAQNQIEQFSIQSNICISFESSDLCLFGVRRRRAWEHFYPFLPSFTARRFVWKIGFVQFVISTTVNRWVSSKIRRTEVTKELLKMRKSQKGTDLNFLPKLFLQITQKSSIGGQSTMSPLSKKRKTDGKTHKM